MIDAGRSHHVPLRLAPSVLLDLDSEQRAFLVLVADYGFQH